MKKRIELNKNNVARLDNTEPFLMPDGLELEFNSTYDLTNAFVSLKNGEAQGQYKLTKTFKVDEKFLIAGTLNVGVIAYHNGTPIKKWAILPIKIIESDYGVVAFDYLADIDKRLSALEKSHQIIK